jgi:hypothetical protein
VATVAAIVVTVYELGAWRPRIRRDPDPRQADLFLLEGLSAAAVDPRSIIGLNVRWLREIARAARGEEDTRMPTADQRIPELSMVVLRHRVRLGSEGPVLSEGHSGTVVHAYKDGEHYEVEFEHPACAVTVARGDIRPA